MQAWGHARLRHCPVLSEHLNPGLRTRFTPAVGSVYHLSFTQHLQYISVYFFLLSLFGVCANEVSVLTITPCIRSPCAILENSWLHPHIYTSAAKPPPKSLCVQQPAGPLSWAMMQPFQEDPGHPLWNMFYCPLDTSLSLGWQAGWDKGCTRAFC